jgi:hypothetical protein
MRKLGSMARARLLVNRWKGIDVKVGDAQW